MDKLHSIPLPGIDGGNPLGFLAALGTWRTVDRIYPETRLNWEPHGGHWAPVLHITEKTSRKALVEKIDFNLKKLAQYSIFNFAQNLNNKSDDFNKQEVLALDHWFEIKDPIGVEFIVSFGSSMLVNKKGNIQTTALYLLRGAGNQHFLKTCRLLIEKTKFQHLYKTLFDPWIYDDASKSMTLRLDPEDDNRHALRWRDPSGDPERDEKGAVWGANRLAIEGLPLLPTIPVGSHLKTTGFVGNRSGNTFWVWPLWKGRFSLDTGRSLLASQSFRSPDLDFYDLSERGIAAVYRSQLISVGNYRNFSPGYSIYSTWK